MTTTHFAVCTMVGDIFTFLNFCGYGTAAVITRAR